MDENKPPQQGTIQIPAGTWPFIVAGLCGMLLLLWNKIGDLENKLESSKDQNIEVLIKANEFAVKNNEHALRNKQQSEAVLDITNENELLKDSLIYLNRRLRGGAAK